MAKKIGVVLAVDGEKQFTQAMTNVNTALKTTKSESAKVKAEFEGQRNTLQALSAVHTVLTKKLGEQEAKQKVASKALENANQNYTAATKRLEELKNAMEDAKKKQEEMASSGNASKKELNEQAKAVNDYEKAVGRQTEEVTRCENKIQNWQAKLNTADRELIETNQSLNKNAAYMAEAEKATDQCATSLDKFGQKVSEARDVTSSLGEKIKTGLVTTGVELAAKAASKVVDAIADAAKYAVDVGSSFEAAMSEVAAISGATGEAFDALSDKAKELGANTKFSATDAANAMTNMSLAGWTTEQTLAGIDGVMQLAAASGMDLADAAQVVTDNISSFNLQASQSETVADMLAYAQAHSATTAAELGEAYQNCAANMNSAGQDIETTTSMLEALANNGLRGSEAGTALSAVVRDMTSKMKDGKITIGDTSVAIADAQGNFRDLTDIMTDVEAATDGMGDADRKYALQSVFTSEAIKALSIIMNEGMDDISGYEDALRQCGGAAKETADVMNDNLKGDLADMESAFEGLGIAAYEVIDGPLRTGVQFVTDAVTGLTEAITPQKTAMEEMYDEILSSSQAVADNVQAIGDKFTGSLENAENVGALTDRLIELNNVQDRTNVQKQEMAAIVDQLSGSIPSLSGAYDEENDKLGVTNEELRELAENYQNVAVKQALAQATQDLVTQSLEAQKVKDNAEAQKESISARIKLLEDEKKLIAEIDQQSYDLANGKISDDGSTQILDYKTEALKLYSDALKAGIITQEEYNAAEKALSDASMQHRYDVLTGQAKSYGDETGILTENINTLTDQESGLIEVIGEQDETLGNCKQKMEEYTTSAENLIGANKDEADATQESTDALNENTDAQGNNTDSLNNNTDALEENVEAANASAEAQKTAMQSIREAYESARSEIESSLQNKISLTDMFDGGEDVTTEQINANLQSQIDGINKYKENLEIVKNATDESGKAIFSPEVISALEEGGLDYANVLEHIAWTLENQGEYGVEQAKGINDKWVQALDMTESMAEVQAANRVAIEQMTGELGSTDVEFDTLRQSLSGLPEATRTTLEETINTAQQCGIKIPEGLAEGIASGETAPEEAVSQLNAAIQGTFEGLAEIGESLGLDDDILAGLSEGIQKGGQDAVDAMSELVSMIASVSPEVQQAITESTKADGVESSVRETMESGAAAIEESAETYKGKAETVGTSIAEGIKTTGKEAVASAVKEIVAAGAEEVGSNSDAWVQAGAQLGEKLAEGLQQAITGSGGSVVLNPNSITQQSGEYQAAGQSLGQSVATGLASTETTINAALAVSPESLEGRNGDFETTGADLGGSFATGLDASQAVAGAAGSAVVGEAMRLIMSKQGAFGTAGTTSTQSYSSALQSGVGAAGSAGGAMGSAAYNGAMSWSYAFYSVGYNMSAGMASGIYGGQSSVISAASAVAAAALSAAKSALGIHSPSKKFREQVGHQIAKGMAFGIKDKASMAGKQAAKMSNKVYTNATSWLTKYRKTHQVTLAEEKWYWQQVQKHVKKGSDAYTKAALKIKQISIQQTGVTSALAGQIAKNFGVSKTTTTGSGKNKKTKKKTDATYYSEIYSAAEKYLSNYQTLHNMSLEQEKAYWVSVQKQLKKGTQGYYDAQKQINSLNEDIAQAAKDRLTTQASVQDDILDKYKVYYKVSAKAEMDYWNIARKQFKAGTDERIEADQKYLEAQQDWYDQRKELDEDYLENSKDINDELEESIKDLQDAYKDAVSERKKDILSSMDLFEAWDSDGYTMDTLLYNLETQVKGLALWEQQLEKLKERGISTDLYDYLLDQGPDAAANIYSLANATDEQLAAYEKLFQQKNELAESQAVKDNETLRQDTNKEIAQLRADAQAELNTLNADYKAALQELNAGLDSSLSTLLNKASQIGEDAVSGLIGGINKASNSVDVYNSTTQVVSNISSNLSNLQQEGTIIGQNTLDGILEGMTDTTKVEDATKKLVDSIKRAMEEAADIHSPSRLFADAIGKQVAAGVAVGMEDGATTAVRSAQDMVQDTLDAAQDEMQKRQAELQTDLPDYSGVVKLNRMMETYQPQAAIVNVDNSGILVAMQSMVATVQNLIENVSDMKVVMDSGEMVGALQAPLSQANAAVMNRRRRLR